MLESVNPQKLHQELKTAGLPVVSVSSSGRIDYSRLLTTSEQESAKKLIHEHNPSMPDSNIFIQRLAQAGLSRDDILYVLWKSVAEGDNLNKDRLIETLNQF